MELRARGKKVYRQHDILDRMNDAWHETHSSEAAKEAAAVAAEAGSKISMDRFIEKVRGLNYRSRKQKPAGTKPHSGH